MQRSELHGTIYVWEAMAIVHEHNRYHSAGSATNDPFSQIFATPSLGVLSFEKFILLRIV